MDDLYDVNNVALIPPVPDVHWTSTMRFHLCEAPIVLKDEGYERYYRWHTQEKGHYVIIDNGASIGRTIQDDQLALAAHKVWADEVVVPDELANREITYSRAKIFLKSYAGEFNTLMFVPQGMNAESWYASFQELVLLAREYEVKRIIIGIGKHMHVRVPGGRSLLVEQCAQQGLTVHLLGASDEPLEDLLLLDKPNVRGYDTSLPFALAQQGYALVESPTWGNWVSPPLEGRRESLRFFETSWPLGHINADHFLGWVHERRAASRP